jgi:hypothetical protein
VVVEEEQDQQVLQVVQEVLVEMVSQHLMATLEFLHLMELLDQLQEDGLQEEAAAVEVCQHLAAAALQELVLELQQLQTLEGGAEEPCPLIHLGVEVLTVSSSSVIVCSRNS